MLCSFRTLCLILSCATGLAGQTVRVNTEGAKVRSYGGLQHEVVATLDRGVSLRVVGIMRQLEELGDYGMNCWLEVQLDTTTGYLYGALATLEPELEGLQNNRQDAFIHSVSLNANIRSAPNQDAFCLFQLYEGDYCQVIARTEEEEFISGLGTYPWYLIQSKNRVGFVFGGLLAFESDYLTILEDDVQLLDEGQQPAIVVNEGDRFQVLGRSQNSQVIHPYGRRFWYLIRVENEGNFWVYGGFTSWEYESVDCQCVDYLKHYLRITGPTGHAFQWPDILAGGISVVQRGSDRYLDYDEVPFSQIKNKDIAVFDPEHPQADDQYGHIGIVREARQNEAGYWEVLIEGGNHKAPYVKGYYAEYRCQNISQKWYEVTDDVHFFRKNGR